ncbi:MAG: O-antigen ligase family protein [Chloroflexota bacterium]
MLTAEALRRGRLLPLYFGVVALVVGVSAGILVASVPNSLRLFVIVIGIFIFLASVARVDWGLLVLILISYTRFSDIAIKYHGAPSFAKAFVVLVGIAILIRWVVYGERPAGWQKATILLAAYGLVGYASIIYAADALRVQEATLNFLKDAAIAIIITILLHRGKMLRQVIWVLLAAGIFLGTLSIIQYFTGTFENNYWGFAQADMQHLAGQTKGYRVTGPIGDPNFYAQIMLVLIPLALDRLWNERKQSLRLIAIWAIVVCSLSVVLTYSRGGFVALAVVAALLLIYYRPKPMAWLITLLVVLVVIQFVPAVYTERIMSLSDFLPDAASSEQPGATFRGRASELIVGWLMFRDSPLVGVGYNNYPVYYQEYSRRVGLDPRIAERSAHNLYIEIAAETGLLGLTVFGLIVWDSMQGVWLAWKKFKAAQMNDFAGIVAAFGIGLAGYLVAGLFIHDAYPRYLWILIGIALAIQNVVKNELAVKSFVAENSVIR